MVEPQKIPQSRGADRINATNGSSGFVRIESDNRNMRIRLAHNAERIKSNNISLTELDITEIEQDLHTYRCTGRHIFGHAYSAVLLLTALGTMVVALLMLGMAIHGVVELFSGRQASYLLSNLLGTVAFGLCSVIATEGVSRKTTAHAYYRTLVHALKPVSRSRLKTCARWCELNTGSRKILREVEGGVLRQYHFDAMERAYFTDQDFQDVGVFGAIMGAAGPLLFVVLIMSAGYYMQSTPAV